MSFTGLGWQRDAACRGSDPELFFAAEFEYPADRQLREATAKAICSGCPVRMPCLEYRLSFERQIDDDIWGGLDGPERRALRNARQKREQRRERRAA